MTSIRAQLLIYRRRYERLSRLFGCHLPFHRQTTASGGIGTNSAVRTDHVPAQDLKALKGATDLLFDAATKSDGYRLPLNFGWVADLVRVHFGSPVVVPCAKRKTGDFVPAQLFSGGRRA